MKYSILLLLLFACNHNCPPPTRVITKYVEVIVPRIDTLVIIQTYDSVPRNPNAMMYISGTESGPGELFKDGKRSDTIYKNTIIYY